MKRLLILLMFLACVNGCFSMEQSQSDVDDLLEDFVMVEPSNEFVDAWLKEALQEKKYVDEAVEQAPVQSAQEQTYWQSFKNTLLGIPQGIGFLGRAFGLLSTSRWYLDTTLSTILMKEEAKFSESERNTFKAVRARVKDINAQYEERVADIQNTFSDPVKRAAEIDALSGEYLRDLQFIQSLDRPMTGFGVLSSKAHLVLLLTFLKDIRIIQQESAQVTALFPVWASFITNFTAEFLNKIASNPHANTDALVTQRSRNAVSQSERETFLPARRKKIVDTQRVLFEALITGKANVAPVTDQTSLKIGLIMSGGGYRAMTLAAGYLEALEQLGWLDASLYVSTLSGSTWFLSAWLNSGKTIAEFNKDLAQRIPYMQVDYLAMQALNDPTRKEALHYDIIFPKFAFNQPIGSVDLFGWLLSQAVLQGDYTARISNQWPLVKDGAYPFPIYTTISMHNTGREENPHYRYNWYEVNPLEFENVELGLSVPIWSLGREFNAGKSVRTKGLPTYPFEQSFGYMLATFGSAYTINFLKEGERFVSGALGLILNAAQKITTIKRLWPAQSINPWFGLENQPTWLKTKPLLTFVDAGIDFNLPVPPLLKSQRNLDVLIVGDASANIQKTILINDHAFPAEFGKFLLYMHEIKFDASIQSYHVPDLYYEPHVKDGKAPFMAYKPKKDHKLPWLIYINYVKDPALVASALTSDDKELQRLAGIIKDFDPISCEQDGFCGTFNFKYSPDQFEQLKSLGQFNILAHKKELMKALNVQFAVKSQRIACPGCMVMGAYKGNLNIVDSYMKKGIDINNQTVGVPGQFINDAITPLHAAVLAGKAEMADFLLKNGAGINQKSSQGITPLDVAVTMANPEMVRFLLPYHPEISEKALEVAQNAPEIHGILQDEVAQRALPAALNQLVQGLDVLRNLLQPELLGVKIQEDPSIVHKLD